ncbi:hypothetical protein [Lysobacter sp. Root690]|uniref:hypothetical protein n=1 Tax=Lysobacter sp. Root690 TaxID=1736588 RepID=UPI0006F88E71|nr:hypothetical protein [Lysobacter sp. Root690]KRB03394.1 hypothetical protein ASD86_21205 [Lysobacter sp. Root690]
MATPAPTEFIAALDKPHTSAEGARLLETLGLAEADLQPDPLDEVGGRVYEDKSRALQLEYQDEGRRREIAYHDIGEGPWVLVQVFLRSAVAGAEAYPGPLPYGLHFDMSKQQLAQLLGAPDSSDPYVETWQKDGHRVLVNYEPKSGAIKSVGLQAPVM